MFYGWNEGWQTSGEREVSGVYYNEFDKKAALWLRELIKEGVIPDGVIDERSITDVRADELRGFTQCHFFAGVGGWPIALRLAGIPDDFPCWTGSCPCQPFSNAGKRKGMSDERDLWPVFFGLIKEGKPQIVIGEQVSSSEVIGSELEASFVIAVQNGEYAKANKIAKKLAATKGFTYYQRWLDRVYTDMAAEGYAMRFEIVGAHSVGANHIRQRLYWGAARLAQDSASLGRRGRSNGDPVGDNGQIQAPGLVHDERLSNPESLRRGEGDKDSGKSPQSTEQIYRPSDSGHDVQLSDSDSQRCNGQSIPDERRQEMSETAGSSKPCGMAYDNSTGRRELRRGESVSPEFASAECAGLSSFSPWSDFGLVLCRDTDKQGRHRVRRVPAESLLLGVAYGLPEEMDRMRYQSICEHPERAFPLCTKEAVPGRAMLLKGIGNAIVPELAAEFIKTFLMEVNR